MKKVFLGLFCLSFVSSVAWAQQTSDKPRLDKEPENKATFNITGSDKEPENKATFNITVKLIPVSKKEFMKLSFQTIKAGSFMMGSPEDEEDRDEDEDQVEVTITMDFQIQRTEVTQLQYYLITGDNPSYFRGPEYCDNYDEANEICPDHPVENVSWYDAQKFIRLLNDSEGIEGCEENQYTSGCYRFVTEAEFEYATRAGTKMAYFFGNDDSNQLGDYAVYWDNSEIYSKPNNYLQAQLIERGTREVTYGQPNPNNLYGIIGNVSEWTADVYKDKLEGGYDPLNIYYRKFTKCQKCRVIRGGSYDDEAYLLRSANRGKESPNSRYYNVGFRLARTL